MEETESPALHNNLENGDGPQQGGLVEEETAVHSAAVRTESMLSFEEGVDKDVVVPKNNDTSVISAWNLPNYVPSEENHGSDKPLDGPEANMERYDSDDSGQPRMEPQLVSGFELVDSQSKQSEFSSIPTSRSEPVFMQSNNNNNNNNIINNNNHNNDEDPRLINARQDKVMDMNEEDATISPKAALNISTAVVFMGNIDSPIMFNSDEKAAENNDENSTIDEENSSHVNLPLSHNNSQHNISQNVSVISNSVHEDDSGCRPSHPEVLKMDDSAPNTPMAAITSSTAFQSHMLQSSSQGNWDFRSGPVGTADLVRWSEVLDAGLKHAEKKKQQSRYRDYSLGFLGPRNRVRRFFIRIATNFWFNQFILLCIIVNCAFLAMSDPVCDIVLDNPSFDVINTVYPNHNCDSYSGTRAILSGAEPILTSIFLTEMCVKIVAMGLFLHHRAYLRDTWNWIDMFVVLLSLVALLPGVANFSGIRVVRVLRPLRTMNRIKGMRALIAALLRSLKPLANVMVVCFFVFFVFGILGNSLFSGYVRGRCFNQDLTGNYQLLDANTICSVYPGGGTKCGDVFPVELYGNTTCFWNSTVGGDLNPNPVNFISFDNIAEAFLLIFQAISMEGWTDIMYTYESGHDVYGARVFFICLICVGAFYSINLALAVITHKFTASALEEKKLQEEEEKLLPLSSHSKANTPRINAEHDNRLTWVLRVRFWFEETAEVWLRLLKTPYDPETKVGKFRQYVRRIATADAFGMTITGAIIVNSAVLAMDFHDQPTFEEKICESVSGGLASGPLFGVRNVSSDAAAELIGCLWKMGAQQGMPWKPDAAFWGSVKYESICSNNACSSLSASKSSALDTINLVMTIVFIGEFACKVVAFGVWEYFVETANKFDAFVVIASIVELATSRNGGGSTISALRALRLFRVFKLARRWTGLRIILKTIQTSTVSLAPLTIVLIIYMYMGSLLGMLFFGCKFLYPVQRPDYEFPSNIEFYTPRSNFDSFLPSDTGFGGMLTVYQITTGENWNNVLYDGMNYTGWYASVYFVVLVVVGNYIIMNLFLAILLHSFWMVHESAAKADPALDIIHGGGTRSFSKKVMMRIMYKSNQIHPIAAIENESGGGDGGDGEDGNEGKNVGDDLIQSLEKNNSDNNNNNNNNGVNNHSMNGSLMVSVKVIHPEQQQQQQNGGANNNNNNNNNNSNNSSDEVVMIKDRSELVTPATLFSATTPSSINNNSNGSSKAPFHHLPPISSNTSTSSDVSVAAAGVELPAKLMLNAEQAFVHSADDDVNSVANENNNNKAGHADTNGPLKISKSSAGGASSARQQRPILDMDRFIDSTATKMNGTVITNNNNNNANKVENPRMMRSYRSNRSNNSRSQTPSETSTPAGDVSVSKMASSDLWEQFSSRNAELRWPFKQFYNISQNEWIERALNRHCSLGVLGPEDGIKWLHPIQKIAFAIVDSSKFGGWFDKFNILAILVSTVMLAMENPKMELDCQNCPVGQYCSVCDWVTTFNVVDVVMLVIFSVELFLKILAYGLFMHYGSYCRDPWNILDAFIVIMSFVSVVLGSSRLKALRTIRAFRTLRPLRVLKRNQGMKISVICILKCIPAAFNVGVVSILFFAMFAVLGIQFFKGTFFACYIGSTSDGNLLNYFPSDPTRPVLTILDCAAAGGYWLGPTSSYDSFGPALLTIFEVAMIDGWLTVMQNSMDAVGIGYTPRRNYNALLPALFTMALNLIVSFVLSLFVGIVIDNYHRTKAEMEGALVMSAAQKEWVAAQKIALKSKPSVPLVAPRNKFSQLVMNHVITKKWFEYTVTGAIVLNTLVMASNTLDQPSAVDDALYYSNAAFTIFFAMEATFKTVAMGWRIYFRDQWNIFDFVVVLLSVAGLVVDRVTNGVFNIPGITVFRAFRIVRLFRLVRRMKRLRQLMEALVHSLPALFNVGSLLLLYFIIYATLAVAFFWNVKQNQDSNAFLSAHANFSDFGTAMSTLFRMITGEAWNGIMHYCMQDGPAYQSCQDVSYNDGCGSANVALIVFVSFKIFGAFIMLNLFVAFILDSFEHAVQENHQIVPKDDLLRFPRIWQSFDVMATQTLTVKQLPLFLRQLPPPLGLKGKKMSNAGMVQFINVLQIPSHNSTVHYLEVFYATLGRVLKVSLPSHHKILRKMEAEIRYRLENTFGKNYITDETDAGMEHAACILQRLVKNKQRMEVVKKTNEAARMVVVR